MRGYRLRAALALLAVTGLGACASVGSAPPAAGPAAAPVLETRGLYRAACAPTAVFAEPSDRAPHLETLAAGDLVSAVDDGSAWALVRRNGSDGFVDWRCLTPPEDFDAARPAQTDSAAPPGPGLVTSQAFAPPPLAQAGAGPERAPSGFTFGAHGFSDAPGAAETVFDPDAGYNPLDRQRPVASPPPTMRLAAPAVAARSGSAPSAMRPQTVATGGAATRFPDPPTESPGLRPPPPDEQFGAMGTDSPVTAPPPAQRSVSPPVFAAAPPGAPERGGLRPVTRLGPPPRYSAILRDARGGPAPDVAAAAPRAPPDGVYAVQIGSYRMPANAARAVARARAMGFAARIIRAGALHRIRLTGFGDYAAAEAERARYIASGGHDAWVVRM